MNIITKKIRLVPAPAPFVGTTIGIQVDDSLVFKIRAGELADDSDHVTVDWGDGTTEVFTANISGTEHNYAAPGTYNIKISDDLKMMFFGGSDTSQYAAIYAPMIISFISNATRVTATKSNQFCNCVNLSHFDVSDSMLQAITSSVFKNCRSLVGELFFPKVASITSISTSMPFDGCPNITALHFAKENEGAIKAGTSYTADTTLGTGVRDVCQFDL